MVLAHEAQVPFAVADDPLRNLFAEHLGWLTHWNPSVVPEHEPVRYCVESQLALLQLEHWYPFVVSLQLPCRYWPDGQLVAEQALHA